MATWLIIANATTAFIYDISKDVHRETLHGGRKARHRLLIELNHEKSRLKTSELVDDDQGHYQSGGVSRGKYESHSDPHHQEHEFFAKEIAEYLESERLKNHYESLVLCAGPHFHGLLNKALSKPTAQRIQKHIEKDYVPLPESERHEAIEHIYSQLV
jgi:protein required for attachment to host cells